MKSLQEFYNDKETMNNVKAYLIDYLEKESIIQVFARQDISGIADAKEIIDKAFENLEVLFARKVVKNTNNEAR